MPVLLLLLLILTFPYWFPVVATPVIAIGLVWLVCYPIACTAHQLYMLARYRVLVPWEMLPERQGR
jgi:hypothetical protein